MLKETKKNSEDMHVVKNSLRKMYEAKKEYERAKKYYDDVRKKEALIVSNYMFTHLERNQNSFDITLDEGAYFYQNKKDFSVSRIRKKKVIWDIEKLKAKLPKNVLKNVIDREILISDFSGLVEYLKTCGVDPKKFKTFLEVRESVNQTSLDQAYSLGDIKERDIELCYTVEVGDMYIRMVEKKKDDPGI